MEKLTCTICGKERGQLSKYLDDYECEVFLCSDFFCDKEFFGHTINPVYKGEVTK